MDWSLATWWWIATGLLVAAEVATGTFYLLMLAVGTLAAAIAAHFGVPFTGQLVAAALVGGGAVAAWYVKRSNEPKAAHGHQINLDVGERVSVAHWEADGSARVTYRGAAWNARFAGTGDPTPGEHVIRAVDGTRLLLDRAP